MEPSKAEVNNVMFGYTLCIRGLTDEDIRVYGVQLGDANRESCVAIEPADLGPCLGAVVDLDSGSVIWSDTDGKGTPLTNMDPRSTPFTAETFAKAVQVVLISMFEHLRSE